MYIFWIALTTANSCFHKYTRAHIDQEVTLSNIYEYTRICNKRIFVRTYSNEAEGKHEVNVYACMLMCPIYEYIFVCATSIFGYNVPICAIIRCSIG